MEEFLGDEASRAEHTRDEQKVDAQQLDGKSTFTRARVANDGSRSQRDAREVLLSERRAAEDTIHRQDVPPGYKRYLETYFQGIEPESDR